MARQRYSRKHQLMNAQHPNAKWRREPASESQWTVLRRIGRETGEIFDAGITRGEASELIARRFAEDPSAARYSRRAQARKRRGT